MLETSWCGLSDHMSGCTENQVLWQIAIFLLILLDNPILSRGDPVKGSGSVLRHLADVPKVRHGLNVTRIVPSEEIHIPLVDNMNHRSGPAGILETLISVLQSSLDDGKDIATLQSIATLADRSFLVSQFRAGCTPLRRDTRGPSGHLRWLRQPADDGFHILHAGRTHDMRIVDGNGISLSDGEIHGDHASIIHYGAR